jgi:catechol 2,3-dioxygenase-like lactoylglutathione lyase family enzyme
MSPSTADWWVRSVLIAVRHLQTSVDFYRDIMNLDELARDEQVAILGTHSTENSALILREAVAHATRHGQQALGLRALCINLGARAELDRVEERLRDRGALIRRQLLPEGKKPPFEIVRGHDPDDLPLVFVSYEGLSLLPEEHYGSVALNMYGLDV